jgi:hypothetical protein
MLICLSRRKEEVEEDRRRNHVPHLHAQEMVLRTSFTTDRLLLLGRYNTDNAGFAFAFIITEPREFSRYTDGLGGRGSIPGRDRDFSLLHSVQTGSRAHQAPILWVAGAKRTRREANHSPI